MKKEILKVAITGGIGSGKSTVARYLREKGFSVFSCDEIYKEIYPTEEYQLTLAQAFPDCLVNGKIEKNLLSKKVFSDANALRKLNELSHQRIMTALHEKMSKASSKAVFAEVPLLFEGHYESDFDKVIVVLRNRKNRIDAVSLRDNTTSEAVQQRMDKQFDYDNKQNVSILKKCGYFLIQNESDEKSVQIEVEKFLAKEIYQ